MTTDKSAYSGVTTVSVSLTLFACKLWKLVTRDGVSGDNCSSLRTNHFTHTNCICKMFAYLQFCAGLLTLVTMTILAARICTVCSLLYTLSFTGVYHVIPARASPSAWSLGPLSPTRGPRHPPAPRGLEAVTHWEWGVGKYMLGISLY